VTALILPDACPVCPPPFDADGCPALTVQPAEAGTVTSHECGLCGSSWRTFRDIYGWVIVRLLDPVSPAQAEINLDVLKLALAEQERERRSAA
jgi:hypothetical protein